MVAFDWSPAPRSDPNRCRSVQSCHAFVLGCKIAFSTSVILLLYLFTSLPKLDGTTSETCVFRKSTKKGFPLESIASWFGDTGQEHFRVVSPNAPTTVSKVYGKLSISKLVHPRNEKLYYSLSPKQRISLGSNQREYKLV